MVIIEDTAALFVKFLTSQEVSSGRRLYSEILISSELVFRRAADLTSVTNAPIEKNVTKINNKLYAQSGFSYY